MLRVAYVASGANVGVHFDREWEPIIQKRGGIIGFGEKPQYAYWNINQDDLVFFRPDIPLFLLKTLLYHCIHKDGSDLFF